MSFDIFLSYSSKDKPIADALVAALESKNLRCWYAPRDIKPGAKWAESITDAISQCKLFLLIFSRNSNQSSQVLDEISYAISEEKTIIPFRIENLDPSGAMRLHLSSRHWLDAYDPSWEEHINSLLNSIALNLGVELPEDEEPGGAPPPPAEKPEAVATMVEPVVETKPQTTLPSFEPKKKLPWLWIGITGVLAIILIFILGIVFIPQIMGGGTQTAMEEQAETPSKQEEEASEIAVSTTSTPQPAEESTFQHDDETLEAASTLRNTVEAYIEGADPTFEEDFSNPPEMDFCNNGSIMLSDMVQEDTLHIAITNGDEDELICFPNFAETRGENIFFQFDFAPTGPGVILGIHNMDALAGEDLILRIAASADTLYWMLDPTNANNQEAAEQSGQLDYRPGLSSTLKIIVLDYQYAVFLNGTLLAYLDNFNISADQPISMDIEIAGSGSVSIDNIRFWNLDGVSIQEDTSVVGESDSSLAKLVKKINSITPTLEEDFSVRKGDWFSEITVNESGPMSLDDFVKDGYLLLEEPARDEDPEVGAVNIVSLSLSDILGENVVMQFDFIPHILDGELNRIQIYSKNEGGFGKTVWIHLYLGDEKRWTLNENVNGDENQLEAGEISAEVYEGGVNTMQFVKQGQDSALFLNGGMVFSSGEGVLSGEETGIKILSSGAMRFDLDNFKFWDLDKITIFDVEDSPFAAVFDYAAITPPSFQEDFSTPQFYWDSTEIYNDGTNSDSLGEYVSDGVLRLHATTDDEKELSYNLYLDAIRGENIILMFDFIPHEFKERSGIDIHKGDELSGSNIFNLALGNETIWEVKPENNLGTDNTLIAEGQGNPRVSEVNTLLLVVFQGQSGVFLNGELLGTFETPVFSGENIDFGALSPGSIKIDIDNIRFWNLDGVEVIP